VLRIHASHRTEWLLDAFVRNVMAERRGASAFTPVHVVVPNQHVETFLRLGVAERLGIAANLETSFLRRFLAGLAEQALPAARVADATVIEGHLLAVLHDAKLLARPELARVRAYLHAAGAEGDAVDRRRCQLAASLARLYDEYAASRPALVAGWRAGKASGEGDMETWQRALWLAVCGPRGRLARQGKRDGLRWLTLAALWDQMRKRLPTTCAGLRVHVFGLSYIATAYHRMLEDLGRACDVILYTLNPCREEVPRSDPGVAPDPHLHPVLAQWARPGRENLHLLARLQDATVEQSFPADDGTTLLRRLQHDIAQRQPPTACELDQSLRILPCPSLRRELEVVAAEIWALLRADPTLRACDVAIIVPETSKDLYLAQLPAVFHESCDLPHNATDLPGASSHRVADAIARLLDLPFSAFTRKQLLPLLTHPSLLARFPAATSEGWRVLADELGIVRGADRSDFAAGYLEHDRFSWDQGLARLALGAVADGAAVEPAAPLAFGGELYLPGPPVDESQPEAQLGFGLLARSLLADAAFAAGRSGPRERPLPEWLAFVRGLLRAYLVLDEDDAAGHAVIARLLAALDAFDEAGLDDVRVSYRAAAELAKRALTSLPASRGHYLASGVTVASFVPMRAIPFRAVFVLGLGQAAFPRPPGRDELDLRRDSHLPGDVDRREQDLYMFLETLLSARDHLCLSYVSRDEITGDELPASPLLLELRAVLGAGYLDQSQLARLFGDDRRDRPTLRRYDDREERRAVLPAAQAEHLAKLGIVDGNPGRVPLPSAPASRPASPSLRPASHALAPPGEAQLRQHDRASAQVLAPPTVVPPTATSPPRSVVDVPLSVLKRFLQDPLQGSAGFLLGLTDDDSNEVADVEDEPFDMDKRLVSAILRESMSAAILDAQGPPAWDALDRARAQRVLAAELAGRSPAGLFGAAGAARLVQILRDWHGPLGEILGPAALSCRSFRFVPSLAGGDHGETPGPGNVGFRPAPAFTIELPAGAGQPTRAVTVRLVGGTGLWAATKGQGEHALSFTCRSSLEPRQLGVEDLRVFLEYAALTVTSSAASPGASSVLFFAKSGQAGQHVRRFAALSAARAREYLQQLCVELLVGARDASGGASFAHPYLLPCEAVLASHRSGRPVAEEIERRREGSRRLSSQYGPLADAGERYAPPPPAEAERMIDARFGLLFELDQGEDAP
jgi:exodeoxyribonuclease V gamma subunit